MNFRNHAVWIVLCLATCLAGCGSLVNGIAAQTGGAAGAAAGRTAPPAAVDKLIEIDTPVYRERIASIVRSETVRDASRVLGTGVGRGLIDEVVAAASDTMSQFAASQPADSQPADTERARNAATRPRLKVGNVKLQSIFTNQIDPIVGEIARTFVNEGIKAATGPEAQEGARAITRATSDGAMRGAIDALKDHGPVLKEVIITQFGPAIGEALRQQITPWVQELRRQNFRSDIHTVLHEELAPAVRQLWDQGAKDTLLIPTQPDIAQSVVTNSRNLSKGAGFGTHDAMIELGVLNSTGNFTSPLKFALWGAVLVGTLIGIAAASSIVVMLMLIVRMAKTPATSRQDRIDPR